MATDESPEANPLLPDPAGIDAIGQLPEPFDDVPDLTIEPDSDSDRIDWKQLLPYAALFVGVLYVTTTTALLFMRPAVTVAPVRKERTNSARTSTTLGAAPTISEGDGRVREGDFARAKQIYESLGGKEIETAPVSLRYRLGLCEEALGRYDQALTVYREISESTVDPLLHRLSRVSQARVWLRMNKLDQVRELLALMPLEGDSPMLANHPVSAEATFLLALSSAYFDSPAELPEDEPRISRTPKDWSVDAMIKWVDEVSIQNAEATAKVSDSRRKRADFVPELLSLPLAASVSIPEAETSVTELIELVSAEAKFAVEFLGTSKELVGNRKVTSQGVKVPLATALVGLTAPFSLDWVVVDQTIRIAPKTDELFKKTKSEAEPTDADAPKTYRSGNASLSELALRMAVARFPKHHLAASANLEIGNVLFERGAYAQALIEYQDLVRKVTSPNSIAAAYNVGLAYRKLNRFDEARTSLYRVLDGNPEHRLAPISAYLVGRMFLDEGRNREAIAPLEIASRAKISGVDRAAASVYAAIAHLLVDGYHEAGQILFANREAFQQQNVLRDAAAFLNSYARYLMLRGNSELQRRETVYLFRSLFALGSQPTWMGSYGMLLVGRAYRDLGMTSQMKRVFERAFSDGATGVIAAEMRYLTFESDLETDGDSAAEKEQLRKFSIAEFDNKWGQRARLTLAKLDLTQKRYDECLATCRELLKAQYIESFESLKVMGQAYEKLGQQRNAALCFAGQVPPP